MTVTLITGANKGLGYETARQLTQRGHAVYIGARNRELGEAAAATLDARYVQLDVTNDASVESAMQMIKEREGLLDVLVNNAGFSEGRVGVDGLTGAGALKEFDTNAVGVIRVTQAALPLLRKSENPIVVNVSSNLGSFWNVTTPELSQSLVPVIVYSATKAAVSILTVQYAKAVPEIKFNAAAPGFTATDLTGGRGQPVAEGAEVIVRLATVELDGPTGTFEDKAGPLRW